MIAALLGALHVIQGGLRGLLVLRLYLYRVHDCGAARCSVRHSAPLARPVDAQTVKHLPVRHPARLAWPVDAQTVKRLPMRHPAPLAWPVDAQTVKQLPRVHDRGAARYSVRHPAPLARPVSYSVDV